MPLEAASSPRAGSRSTAPVRSGVRIDCLQQPGDHVRGRVDPGAHAQDEALARAEIEVALEAGELGRDLDVDVAAREQPAWAPAQSVSGLTCSRR